MTATGTTLEPPASPPRRGAAPRPQEPARAAAGQTALVVATVALVVAAVLPLARVFVGLDFLRPVLAAALLAVAVARGARWLGAGPVIELALSAAAWALFTALAFLPHTLVWGVLPTPDTAAAGRDLWLLGVDLIRSRPSPAFAEPGMLLITATGVWWVAHAIEGLVFRLRAPLRAIAMALLLWTVPLAMAASAPRPWLWALPLLAAGAGLLLASNRAQLGEAGARAPAGPGRSTLDSLTATGWGVAALAILAGAAFGGLLPGYGEPPYYEVRGLGGTTITTNPIVSIRSSLVSQSRRPVAEVRTPRPVYLRLTALDVYSEREEWTSAGIRGGNATGRLPPETEWVSGRDLDVEVEVRDMPGAVIVPVPYQPVRLSGPAASRFQYDRDGATVTLAAGEWLEEGDVYEVEALLPEPPPEVLAAAPVDGVDAALTALPGSVPEEVGRLARDVVEAAGAETPFDQAMALQQELRSWTYSLDPPQGHSSSAMLSFIEQRVGYCEQFAGTMAVMLRTLGIPARVAVGYTPGDLVAEEGERESYLVTSANAHAWVEVLFPGLGWIAFEPTPRSDGNLLTPTASNLLPSATDAQQRLPEGGFAPALEDDELLLQRLLEEERAAGAAGGSASDGESGGGRVPVGGVAAALLAAVALLAGAAGWRRRRGDPDALVPAETVLRAVERVERAGRGLGMPRRLAETDREYLQRLAGPVTDARALAVAAARARYAPFVPAAVASGAESAAAAVLGRLRGDRSRLGWAAASARGRLAGTLALLRARARRSRGTMAGAEQPSTERMARLVRRRTVRRDLSRTR